MNLLLSALLNANVVNTDTMSNFYKSLEIMGLGMLGIFIVMLIIFLVILLLGKIPDKSNDDQ